MLICADCGLIFGEDELAEWYEDRGEFWGFPCTERMTGCPRCFSGAVDDYYGEDEEEEEEGDDDDGRTD